MRKVLTVGDLRKILAEIHPDTEVVIATEHWFDNVGAVEMPDGVNTVCVTLHRSSPDTVGDYDTRQHAFGVVPAEVL